MTGANRVAIIGAGLAGLAAATALATRGFAVTVFEGRNRIGGRASSFLDPQSGQTLDNCQHVSMGCCTNFKHFCRCVCISHFMQPQPKLWFMSPDRRVSQFASGPLPAPLHLAGSFFRAHYLTLSEKLRIAWGLSCLRDSAMEDDVFFLDWLRRHRQTPTTIARFWGLVLVSALNEVPERIGLRYARKVFVDGFLNHRRAFQVELPSVPLGLLYGAQLQKWLQEHGVDLQLNRGARHFQLHGSQVKGIEMRQDSPVRADWYITAVPFDRLLDMLPDDLVSQEAYFGNLRNLETSPITSVHLWFDRPIMRRPHLVLVDCMGQWLFNRGEVAPGEHYIQVVISAARMYQSLGHEEIERRILVELRQLLPSAREARVCRVRVITERSATFCAVPGVDRWRPGQGSPIANLFVAGDWTSTGWPATMESAVRSGYLAAEALLARAGRNERIVQPDLV